MKKIILTIGLAVLAAVVMWGCARLLDLGVGPSDDLVQANVKNVKLEGEVETLKAEVGEITRRVEALEKALGGGGIKIPANIQAVVLNSDGTTDVKATLEEMASQITNLASNDATFLTKMGAAETKLAAVETKIGAVVSLESSLANLSTTDTTVISRIDKIEVSELPAVKSNIETALSKITELATQDSTLSKSLTTALAKISELASADTTLSARLQNTETEISKAVKTIKVLSMDFRFDPPAVSANSSKLVVVPLENLPGFALDAIPAASLIEGVSFYRMKFDTDIKGVQNVYIAAQNTTTTEKDHPPTEIKVYYTLPNDN